MILDVVLVRGKNMSQYTPQLPQQQPSSEETLNQPRQSQQMPPQQEYPSQQPPMYQQPPQRPPKRRKKWPWFLIAAILVIVIIVYAASPKGTATPNTSQPTQPANHPTPTSQPQSSTHNVGEVVVVDSTWTVTVNSVKTSIGDQFSTPKSGDVFIIVDVTIKNTSSSNQNVSSFLSFTFKDSTGQAYTEAITDFNKAPDGTIIPGDILRGQ